MATYPARAVVLQRTKLGEADLILTMLSQSGELIRAVAKGARKPKSKLGAAAGLFRCNDWLLFQGRNLDIVTEARTVESHRNLTSEYRSSLAASVVGEFVAKTHLEGQCEPRIFEMTMVTLGVMDGVAGVAANDEAAVPMEGQRRTDGRIDAVLLAYLIKSLAMHGYRPSADACAECGLPMAEMDGSVRWSTLVAGVLCEDCSPTAVDVRTIPAAAASWVCFMLNSTLADVSAAEVPPPALDDLFELVASLLDTHVQTRLKSLEVYRAERATNQPISGGAAGLGEPPLR